MNTLSLVINFAFAFAAQQGNPQPSVDYVPVGHIAGTASPCTMFAVSDGVVLYCAAENRIVVMAVNNKELTE